MLNKENIAYKRGQVYTDESGNQWVYWGTIRNYGSTDKGGPVSKTNPIVGAFYKVGNTPKGYRTWHESHRYDLQYEKLSFLANSVKELALATSGADIKLINLINVGISHIKKLDKPDNEWSYDAVVYWMSGLKSFVKCLEDLVPGAENKCVGHYSFKSIFDDELRNSNIAAKLEEPIKNANEPTIIELKKLAKIIEKERIKILKNENVKRLYVEGYIDKYYGGTEKEFLDSLISWPMISVMDFVDGGLSIDNVNVEEKVSESGSGSIVYWSYRNVGSAEINGVVHTGDFYSKKSHGWNYND